MKLQNLLIISTALLSGTQVLSRSVVELMAAEGIEIVDNRLDLSNKGLTSLEGLTGIDGIEGVQRLYLDYNQLSTLPVGVFNGLTSLQQLHLDYNQLSTLPAGVFNDLTNLQGLNLEHNPLSTLPAGVFNGLTNLQELHLAYNRLSTLPEGVFNDLTSLQELQLNHNQLSTLPEGVFNDLTSLQQLRLYSNQLSALPAGVFNGLTSLQQLHLYNNRLSVLQVARIEQFAQQHNIGLTIHSQAAPPVALEPNVTKAEFDALGLSEEDKECPSCYEKIHGEETYLNYLTECGHRFHAKCLEDWLRHSRSTSCPICRQDVFTGGPSQAMPIAQNHTKQKKNLHLAKNTTKKGRKNHRIHVAHHTKKMRAVHA